jgi:hypothetical protein
MKRSHKLARAQEWVLKGFLSLLFFFLTVCASVQPLKAQIAFEEVQTGGSEEELTVTTSANLTAVDHHLYLAAVNSTDEGSNSVVSVSGLGLNWTLVKAQCSGRNTQRVEVWMAIGTPSSDGTVSAILSSEPEEYAAIAVSRYSGVDSNNPIGDIISANTNGVDGLCSGGSDNDSYSVDLTIVAPNSFAYGAVAMQHRTHTPGTGFTERVEFNYGDDDDDDDDEMAGIALEDKLVATASTTAVDGTLSGNADWAVVAVEIMGGGILPIQLAYINANVIANSNDVQVVWRTITETNNYGFYVQQSIDNTNSFADLPNSFVPGHGTTLMPHDYSWTHVGVAPGTCYYRIKQVDLDGTTHFTDAVQVIVDGVTGVENKTVPELFSLAQNYPNPFNPTTTIQFAVAKSGFATLTVFDAIGQEVASLFSGNAESGQLYTVQFDATNVADGMYFYKLVESDQSSIRKMILLT